MDPEISKIISQLVMYMVVLLLSISAHEAGHAWMSHKFGDDTAYMLGRVTLNPAAHTDPIGTLLIPIVSFVISAVGSPLAAIPLIGWGKPTPVNPRNWTNYKTANVMVSIAGVLANLILLVAGIVTAKMMLISGGSVYDFWGQDATPLGMLVGNLMVMNLSLFVFNLLPFPPLDGSKILSTFLPRDLEPMWEFLERFGFIILMVFIYFGMFNLIITPFLRALLRILAA